MSEDVIIHGRSKDLGGFSVVRSLPYVGKRSVGPFIFLDHMGPMTVSKTIALDVRSHPHIGLATVTYLFSGRGLHRDSLGSEQMIEPGDLNWMTAGRGIVHSEHSPKEDRISGSVVMHGIQIWVGLPVEQEDCEPSFRHYSKNSLPTFEILEGVKARLMIGEWQGAASPVATLQQTLFMDLSFEREQAGTLNFKEKEIALFVVQGQGAVNGQSVAANDLISLSNPAQAQVAFKAGSRVIVIGGEPFPEPRFMWWNFVSSKKEKIREAAERWRRQEMGIVPGEVDYIPLPNDPLP